MKRGRLSEFIIHKDFCFIFSLEFFSARVPGIGYFVLEHERMLWIEQRVLLSVEYESGAAKERQACTNDLARPAACADATSCYGSLSVNAHVGRHALSPHPREALLAVYSLVRRSSGRVPLARVDYCL